KRRRPRAERRPADAPALPGRAPALRQQLAPIDLGQPVLPGPAFLAHAHQLPAGRRHAGRRRLLRRPPRPPRRAGTGTRGAPPGRRLHHRDLSVISFAHIAGMPVEETIGSLGPALLLALGAASATLRTHSRPRKRPARRQVSRSASPTMMPSGPRRKQSR